MIRHFRRQLPVSLLTGAPLALIVGCATAPPVPPQAPRPAALVKRPTILLVHGAFGGGWGFKEVAERLSADGYTVYRPTLTGQGEKVHLASPSVSLDTHVADIVNVIKFEDLHNVVLVGHSYGGMVITGVVAAVPDRIARVVYLDAFLPLDGESAVDEVKHLQHRAGPTKPDATGYLRPTWVSSTQPLPHDVPQPGATFTQPIHLTASPQLSGTPTTYVLYVPPKRPIDYAKFYYFYQRARSFGWDVTTLTSDHNAQWSHPAELTTLIERLAGGR